MDLASSGNGVNRDLDAGGGDGGDFPSDHALPCADLVCADHICPSKILPCIITTQAVTRIHPPIERLLDILLL